jgi:hypothetical protein
MKKGLFSRTSMITGCVLFNAALGLPVAVAQDSDPWEMRMTAQTVYGSYNDADLRDSLFAAGFFIGGDYLEKGGFTVGYTYTEVDGKGSGAGTFDTLEEDTVYLSGKIHSYPDSLAGRLTWRLDGYLIKDDASGRGNNGNAGGNYAGGDADIGVVNPIVTFINNAKDLSFDLGYAYSNYDYDGGDEFQAHQVTPTVGFAVGGQANWIQLRGYYIHLSDDDVNDGNNDTVALEAKWTHWFGPSGPLGLHSVGLSGMLGERFLAVDSDAAVVYTLADEQQGTAALNGVWKLGEQTSLMLQGGYEQYENRVINNDYDSVYIYLNLSHKW